MQQSKLARNGLRVIVYGRASAKKPGRAEAGKRAKPHLANLPWRRKFAVWSATSPENNMPLWLTGNTM